MMTDGQVRDAGVDSISIPTVDRCYSEKEKSNKASKRIENSTQHTNAQTRSSGGVSTTVRHFLVDLGIAEKSGCVAV